MNDITRLARPEIRNMRPYRPATAEAGFVRLNANETPWRPPGDTTTDGLNYYPDARPLELTRCLADWYGVAPEQLLVTRGSSEAIDLLIRCFCRPGQDDIVICPPTFGMYEVYAQIQGARTLSVPLLESRGFELDTAAIEAAWSETTRLVFVCSPNNPTGNAIPTEQIDALATALAGRGIVVVDAAYVEFADTDPTPALLETHDNVVILRTLSKALGLAGIRCGAALAAAPVIDIMDCILSPYTFPTPCRDAAITRLAPENREEYGRHIATLRAERERVFTTLQGLPFIDLVWPSQANFLLVRVREPRQLTAAARRGGFLVRDFSWDPYTPNCVRLTIGSPDQNDRLLEALAGQG